MDSSIPKCKSLVRIRWSPFLKGPTCSTRPHPAHRHRVRHRPFDDRPHPEAKARHDSHPVPSVSRHSRTSGRCIATHIGGGRTRGLPLPDRTFLKALRSPKEASAPQPVPVDSPRVMSERHSGSAWGIPRRESLPRDSLNLRAAPAIRHDAIRAPSSPDTAHVRRRAQRCFLKTTGVFLNVRGCPSR